MRGAFILLATTVVLLCPNGVRGHGGFVDFGMLDTSDAWRWMSAEMFNAERALGNQYVRVDVVWSEVERVEGALDFSAIDERFAAVARGVPPMRVIATVFVGRGWMSCGRDCDTLVRNGICLAESAECALECACCQRCPLDPSLSKIPADLAEAPDEAVGYSRSYYQFIRTLIARYGEQIDYLIIENEVNDARYWDVALDPNAELYLRLLATARKAVEDTRPGIAVADSGFGSILLGTCIGKDWLESGLLSPAPIHETLSEYFAPLVGTSDEALIPPLGSDAELADYLARFDGCRPLTNLLAKGEVDVWNFHYRASSKTIHLVWDYFATHDPGPVLLRPVLISELGCPRRQGETAEDEARCAFTAVVAAQALGVPVVVWSSGYDRTGVSMWEPDGRERVAARAYRLLAHTLGGRFRTVGFQRGPDVFRVRFVDAGSSQVVVDALWSWDGQSHSYEITETFGYFPQHAIDFLGNLRAVNADPCGRATIEVTQDPLLVFYEQPIPAVATCTRTPTSASTATPTPTPTQAPGPCTGDCNDDGRVSVDELVTSVRVALGLEPTAVCELLDRNGDGTATIDELTTAVSFALHGCPPRP